MTGVEDIEKPSGRKNIEASGSSAAGLVYYQGDKDLHRDKAESDLRDMQFRYEALRAANLALTESLDLDRGFKHPVGLPGKTRAL